MKNKSLLFVVIVGILAMSMQVAIAKKPLTTITFDTVTNVGAFTWSAEGVTFQYSGSYAHIGNITPLGPFTHLQGGILAAESDGSWTITFDKPTTVVEFAVALSEQNSINDAVIVDLYGPGEGSHRQSVLVSLEPAPYWSEGYFSYSGPAVKTMVIQVDEALSFTGFWVDNLVFHK